MTLKRQLVFLGLLTLLLPWFALDYLVKLDSSLRAVRTDGLTEQGSSLARIFSNSNQLMQRLSQRESAVPALWAQPMVASVLDGYLAEWHEQSIQSHVIGGADVNGQADRYSGEFYIGHTAEHLRLAFAFSGVPQWYSPQLDGFDFIIVEFEQAGRFRLIAAASGVAQPQRWLNGRWQSVFSSSAIWLATGNGSSVEWEFPAVYREQSISIAYYRASSGYSVFLMPDNRVFYPAYGEPALLEPLSEVVAPKQRLWLLDTRGHLVGDVGGFDAEHFLPDLKMQRPWLMHWYYWLVNRPEENYKPPDAAKLRRNAHPEWLFQRRAPIARVTTPVYVDNVIKAWLVLDRQEPEFEAKLAALAGRFLLVSVFFVIAVLVILLGFASIHSWRIRRLAGRIERIVDAQGGDDRTDFAESIIPDEIGQLSRSFKQLLGRLGQHQLYLKKLASQLSHELRTPIAVVQSSLDNIEPNEQQSIYVERARSGVHRLSSTLSAMSAANQLEDAMAQADIEQVDIGSMLEALLAAYKDIYGSSLSTEKTKGQTSGQVEGYLNLPTPCDVRLAPELIVQMLDKLMDNAVQFSDEGQPVTLSAEILKSDGLNENTQKKGALEGFLFKSRPSHKRPDDVLVLKVTNIGRALPVSIDAQLFDSMVSDRRGLADSEDIHLGLGLYVARLICEFHGGSIRAYETPLNDASQATSKVTFEVLLPLHFASNSSLG